MSNTSPPSDFERGRMRAEDQRAGVDLGHAQAFAQAQARADLARRPQYMPLTHEVTGTPNRNQPTN